MELLIQDTLVKGAADLGIPLGEYEVSLYDQYLALLLEWNEKINLTAITDPYEIVIKHFIDSLSAVPLIRNRDNVSLLDIGTGAGFPGVPIKIACPLINVVLLDSLNKRIKFLEEIISHLQLKDIFAVHGRAEDFGNKPGFRESYDFVTSRAVARLSVLAELCLPFLKIGGTFLSYKGAKAQEEVGEAKKAIKLLGGEVSEVVDVQLPGLEDKRTVVVITKNSKTPVRFPRKAGTPEKDPL